MRALKTRQKISKIKAKIYSRFLLIVSKRKILSDLYYIFSRRFSLEHQAILAGRAKYRSTLMSNGSVTSLLRRNIHRLEKGLIMKPRKDIFAQSYIDETVSCFGAMVEKADRFSGEIKWALDVLDRYFEVVTEDPKISPARERFINIKNQIILSSSIPKRIPIEQSEFIPYSYEKLKKSDITVNDLEKLYIHRRSVRWYLEKSIPSELVQQAANLSTFAPSACNRQSFKYIFCNDSKKASGIAKCAGGTSGFAENVQSIIIVTGDTSSYPHERDRHLIYIDGSLAAMQFMLALQVLGLSSCPINWPEDESSELLLRKIIDLKKYERVIMLIAVGFADEEESVPYSHKKEGSSILEFV